MADPKMFESSDNDSELPNMEDNGHEIKNGDNYTFVKKIGWFQRMKRALSRLVGSMILIGVMIFLLNQNEKRSDIREAALAHGRSIVTTIDVNTYTPSNNNKLVHTTGFAETPDTLTDEYFSVSEDAIRLKRTVEIYQWSESESTKTVRQLDGSEKQTTTYSYRKVWKEGLIDSDDFKKPQYKNPTTTPIDGRDLLADNRLIGAYRLSPQLARQMDYFQEVDIDPSKTEKLQETGSITYHDNSYYISENPESPKIGDARITFQAVYAGEVSIVAKQVNNTFNTYRSKNGGSILMLEYGQKSASQMFRTAEVKNALWTWAVRLGCLLLIWVGFKSLLDPICIVTDLIPIVGTFVRGAATIIAFFLALITTTLTVIY